MCRTSTDILKKRDARKIKRQLKWNSGTQYSANLIFLVNPTQNSLLFTCATCKHKFKSHERVLFRFKRASANYILHNVPDRPGKRNVSRTNKLTTQQGSQKTQLFAPPSVRCFFLFWASFKNLEMIVKRYHLCRLVSNRPKLGKLLLVANDS